MKKVLALMLASVLTFSAVMYGCSSKKEGGNSNVSNTDSSKTDVSKTEGDGKITDEKVEITFSWWGSENRHNAIEEVIKLYEAEHPNVTIKSEYGAWDGWQANITAQLAGKKEADIVQVNYNWVHSFGKGKNVFANLNDYSDYIDLSNWDQTYLDAMTVGGELAAVPHGMNGRANLYSKPLFEAAGIEYPTTYEELKAAGAVIGANNTATGADNQYVFMNIGKECPDLFIAQMLYNKTGKVMQVDGKVQYTVEEVAEALTTYSSFSEAGAMETYAQLDAMANESNPVWTSGRGGSIYEWVGTMDKYLNSYKGGEAKDEIGVAPYIVEKEGDKPSIYVKPNLGYAVSKNSKNPEVAADFLNFFFTNKEAVETLGTSIGISSNKVTRQYQEDAGNLSGIMQEGFDMLAQYDQTVMDPYFEDSNVRGKRYDAIEAFRSGASSAEDAAKNYIDGQQAELDKLFK